MSIGQKGFGNDVALCTCDGLSRVHVIIFNLRTHFVVCDVGDASQDWRVGRTPLYKPDHDAIRAVRERMGLLVPPPPPPPPHDGARPHRGMQLVNPWVSLAPPGGVAMDGAGNYIVADFHKHGMGWMQRFGSWVDAAFRFMGGCSVSVHVYIFFLH